MDSDRNKKLGAEELERRMAPGMLTYDAPPAEDSAPEGPSGVDTSSKDKKQRKGRNRTQQIVAD